MNNKFTGVMNNSNESKASSPYNLKHFPALCLPARPDLCNAEDLEIGVTMRVSKDFVEIYFLI